MSTQILVVAELHEGSKLRKATFSAAIAFARSAGGSHSRSWSLGSGAKAAAAEVTGYGASQVILSVDDAKPRAPDGVCETVRADHRRRRQGAAASTSSRSRPAPSGRTWRLALRRSSARGTRRTSRGVKADGGKLVFKRPMFAGNAYGFCEVTTAGQGRQRPAKRVRSRPSPAGGASAPSRASPPLAPPDAAAARVEFVSLEAGEERAPGPRRGERHRIRAAAP